ncbi:MAG: hypothetical protein AAF212_11130, partial [Verrucomicrobiota bacterium]
VDCEAPRSTAKPPRNDPNQRKHTNDMHTNECVPENGITYQKKGFGAADHHLYIKNVNTFG